MRGVNPVTTLAWIECQIFFYLHVREETHYFYLIVNNCTQSFNPAMCTFFTLNDDLGGQGNATHVLNILGTHSWAP